MKTEYGYSLSTGTPEYALRTDYEGDNITRRATPWADRANAATGNPSLAYIRGTYNGVATKTSTGGKVYILALPSIFTISGTTTVSEASAASFLVYGKSLSGVAFTPKVVFSSGSLPSSDDERIIFASGVIASYSGTSFATNSDIQTFISAYSSTGALANVGGNFVRTRLGGGA
ncbi:hypothetical protein [Magnetospirillum sulfuroxidans]|uniref:Uncharacterized protein n=1 Tax=Magnetospirillum sulfuroxidans TaxID=611300 RepID=A0ABS5I980_9PROT|nr:hypothetical protein [Magnetospirillum sulfuroxidans]MBR9970879.1 hypothetical protein [Magnetospirillum sulfuroxidans]